MDFRQLVQKEYNHLDCLYFNSAYFGPSPYRAKQKIANATFKELDPSFVDYQVWKGIPERTRGLMAKLLNCSDHNITHTTSSSDLIGQVAFGFPFKEGDIVCAPQGEYPSNTLPWMLAEQRRGINFQLLEKTILTGDDLKEVLPAKTKVVSLSHVAFDSGKKIDVLSIGKFLKERDVFFILDTTQSLGGMPITPEELQYIDVLACSSYKWILGPYGHAFAYFSNEAIEKVDYLNANWLKSPNSMSSNSLLNYTVETLPGARKFDRGQTANMLTTSCLEAALEFLLELGLDNIEKENSKVRNYFLENFPKKKYKLITPVDHMGFIVALKSLSGDSQQLEAELKHRNIDVSVREGNLRLSFHLFNTTSQVDTLIEALGA